MKTTVEIPDAVYRQVKARAALEGKSVKQFLVEALREQLGRRRSVRSAETGWRAVFGKVPARAVGDLQSRLDEEFSRIDLESWQ